MEDGEEGVKRMIGGWGRGSKENDWRVDGEKRMILGYKGESRILKAGWKREGREHEKWEEGSGGDNYRRVGREQ